VPTRTLAGRYDLLRHRLGDGEQTTVYVVRYPRPQTSLSLQHFAVPRQLDHWCREFGVREVTEQQDRRLPLLFHRAELFLGAQLLIADRINPDVVADEEGDVLGDRDPERLGLKPAVSS
jgi:hypothetical protein